jgi:methionyl aminopeptidase
MGIIIKSPREIELMRQAGRITAAILKTLVGKIRPEMRTRELDVIATQELEKYEVGASFKGYRGFPAHLCVSVNDEIVHGIPGERVLKEGDIVSLDMGVIFQGFHGDAALTVVVGEVTSPAGELLAITEGALRAGLSAARHGNHLGDVSAAVQQYAESGGFSVVCEYTGHGIGRELHEEPQVPNFGHPGQGPLLQAGMTLALEPMVNAGGWRTKVDQTGWPVRTVDGRLSDHFEHTVAITDGEPEVLTIA